MKIGLCGLYCFKNKLGEIIYLGKADDIHKRLKTHRHLPKECYEEINYTKSDKTEQQKSYISLYFESPFCFTTGYSV